MLLNKDVFASDPTTSTIPNDGVTKVGEPETAEQLAVLRYELQSFVCEGEYERGLERIMSSYLSSLERDMQPAAWVSGFYGSGKSHLVRVLEYLWRDFEFRDGATARSLAHLTPEIEAHFRELTTAGRRRGGLWSAAGTLGAGAGDSVRLALLSIVFSSAGLPSHYDAARFVIWLKKESYYEAFHQHVLNAGDELEYELRNMFMSSSIAGAIKDIVPGFADTEAEARQTLRAQYRLTSADISDDDFVDTLRDVLELQSETPGQIPATLIVLDEVQQYIGDDQHRALAVQNIVEACSSQFGSSLLFVATGQAALQATPQLQRLQGRFTVRVMLSETDVEHVVREVVLRKAQDKVPALREMLENASGEIDRHLVGTKIGPRSEDSRALVPDYPLLPVRRRFWERILRSVDPSGTIGQLRTQLRIVHEASKDVAGKPLGHVIPADSIYDQVKPDMLQSGELLSDYNLMIDELRDGSADGSADGELKSRLCATIFLIGKLETEGPLASGVQPTAGTLADLLVEDLPSGSSNLRQRIPGLLADLVDAGRLQKVDEEYRLQTRESAEWQSEYRSKRQAILANQSRLAADRGKALRDAIAAELRPISLTQGESRESRKITQHYGMEPPPEGADVPIWIQDGWSEQEPNVVAAAREAGVSSSIVFVHLPRQGHDDLQSALAGAAAARETLDTRGNPSTDEGLEARSGMASRLAGEQRRITSIVNGILERGRIFQGGGSEVIAGTGNSLRLSVQQAAEAGMARLYPDFDVADHPRWSSVFDRINQGNPDALSVVGHSGDVAAHPVCRAIRDFIGSTGKSGRDIQNRFEGPPYGWPRDAISSALLALLASGVITASEAGSPVDYKDLDRRGVWRATYRLEQIVVTTSHRIGIRALLSNVGLPVKSGEESEGIARLLDMLTGLAADAGGNPPSPGRPSTADIEELRSLAGNERFVAVYERREQLESDFNAWSAAGNEIQLRLPHWQMLERLVSHIRGLEIHDDLELQMGAIRQHRNLLDDPNPVQPLLDRVAQALREKLHELRTEFEDQRNQGISELEATGEWSQLTNEQHERILSGAGLRPAPPLPVGTTDDLLHTLDSAPLADWEERIVALPPRFSRVREAAAKLLEPESVRVRPPSGTLRTEAEVEAYVAQLKDEMLGHVREGRPVIV